jgi:hypothetical protein
MGLNVFFLLPIISCYIVRGAEITPFVLQHSLKALPIAPGVGPSANQSRGFEDLNLDAVQGAADWLRSRLGLTVIGFDLVVSSHRSFNGKALVYSHVPPDFFIKLVLVKASMSAVLFKLELRILSTFFITALLSHAG